MGIVAALHTGVGAHLPICSFIPFCMLAVYFSTIRATSGWGGTLLVIVCLTTSKVGLESEKLTVISEKSLKSEPLLRISVSLI